MGIFLNGCSFPVSMAKVDDGQSIRSIADILKENELLTDRVRKLEEEAYTDPLTGAKNRRGGDVLLDQLSGPYVVLMVDVDHFKQINDTYGHAGGDIVLRSAASTIAECVRRATDDVISRRGGDEFLVIMPGCSYEFAVKTAEHVRSSIENKLWDGMPGYKVTVSIGIAYGMPGKDKSDVIRSADEKMYMAKKQQGNCVVY